MPDKQKAAVIGGFVADALSLGVHWVYNTKVIDKKWGTVDRYVDPMTSYHKNKRAGDFTHYGDQTLVLLTSLEQKSGFDAPYFAQMWQNFFSTYDGYVDQATKTTLAAMEAGGALTASGSSSDDLAGASRMVALVGTLANNPEELVAAARTQAEITHNNEQVILCADYFARLVIAVLDGDAPLSALESTLQTKESYEPIADLIVAGVESRERDTRDAVADFGQACSVEGGLPSAVHLIARYPGDFKTAMVENVMAGGDSSARGMLAGMILGAANGMAAIPRQWVSEMNQQHRILELIER